MPPKTGLHTPWGTSTPVKNSHNITTAVIWLLTEKSAMNRNTMKS